MQRPTEFCLCRSPQYTGAHQNSQLFLNYGRGDIVMNNHSNHHGAQSPSKATSMDGIDPLPRTLGSKLCCHIIRMFVNLIPSLIVEEIQ
jgi:hypothetical protein